MNGNRNHISDDVLVKYLLGEATADERSTVGQWMAADENNRKYFEHFRIIWDESKYLASKSTVNENEAWERFVQRTQREEIVAPPAARKIPLQGFAWVRVAAVLLVMAGVGWLMFTMSGGGNELQLASSGNSVLIQTLPDGSTVTLNKNSSLSYPAKFEGGKRMVTLTGEAFFNITPNKKQPFVIDANKTSVTVVGTSFNVKTTTEQTEVIVETGIVEVAKMEHAVRVMPHQKATVTQKSEVPVMEQNTDNLYNYYRTKEFVCNGTPLWKVVAILNDAYGAKIRIEDTKQGNKPVNATFHEDESLDYILNVLSMTVGVTVEKRGQEIILK